MEDTNGQIRRRGPERILVAATLAAVAMLGCSDDNGGTLNPTAPSAVNAPPTASSASTASLVSAVATPTSAGAEAASSGDQITVDSSMTSTRGLNADTNGGVLTANFVLVPSDHDGSPFAVQLHFSEPIDNKPRHVKQAFSQPRMVGQPAAGGSVTKAKRLDSAWVSGKRVTSQWELTVTPSGSGDVELRAAGGRSCSAGSALCTPGRQSLSHDLSATIRDGTASGQGSRPGQTNRPGPVRNMRAERLSRGSYLIYFDIPFDTPTADGALKYEIQVGGCSPGDVVHRRITLTGWSRYYYRVVVAGDNTPAFGVQGINRNGRGPCVRKATTSLPDLRVHSPQALDNPSVAPGEEFILTVTVQNIGNAVFAGHPPLTGYWSTDSTIDTSDTNAGERDSIGGPVDPGESKMLHVAVTAPSTAGTYYFGACIDENDFESDTTNNCTPVALEFEVF